MTHTSAMDLQQAYTAATLSVTEVVSACLERCADDPHNAMISINPDALAAATKADQRYRNGNAIGPWDGMPFVAKDNIAALGLPWTAGIGAYRQRIAETDAELIQWLKQQGAVLIGKSNLHEAALGTSSDNPWFGQCHHPLRRGYSPGGSSGGSAVAVAANYAPLSLGTDTMGSVRIPAVFCGVYGYKPTNGLVSDQGVTRLSTLLDTIGLIAGNAKDLQRYGSTFSQLENDETPTAKTPFLLGILSDDSINDCTDEVIHCYRNAIGLVKQAGVQTIEIDWPDKPTAYRRDGLSLVVDEAYREHAQALAERPEGFSRELTNFLHFGRDRDSAKLTAAQQRIEQLKTRALAQWSDADLAMTPATPCATHPFAEPAPVHLADYTAIANLLGAPSIGLPYGQCNNGLSLGLQLIGQPGQDKALLAQGCFIDDLLNTKIVS